MRRDVRQSAEAVEEYFLASAGALGGVEAGKQMRAAIEKMRGSMSAEIPTSKVGDQVMSFLNQLGVKPHGG